METTEIVSLYQNSSEELYSLFEHYYDHFHANPQNSLHEKFISSNPNSVHALDQLRTIKSKASSPSQFVKKMMASLPYTCQSQSPSPYFDLSIFRYDEKLFSAIDRHRHCTEYPIKFISVRQPNVVKFKIKPGPRRTAKRAWSTPNVLSTSFLAPCLLGKVRSFSPLGSEMVLTKVAHEGYLSSQRWY
uniref:Uncharacterized protein n=1 Tax=Triticum urartu TaxID=4572 RepID=A0A8R7VJD6_TRIUA